MKVDEVMTWGVEPISPDLSVKDAAIWMAELDVGALPIEAVAKRHSRETLRRPSGSEAQRYTAGIR